MPYNVVGRANSIFLVRRFGKILMLSAWLEPRASGAYATRTWSLHMKILGVLGKNCGGLGNI
jgi:hypothetical protein